MLEYRNHTRAFLKASVSEIRNLITQRNVHPWCSVTSITIMFKGTHRVHQSIFIGGAPGSYLCRDSTLVQCVSTFMQWIIAALFALDFPKDGHAHSNNAQSKDDQH